jgi:CRISPR/Cas system-associated endoribonuclease Cas2
MKKQENYEYEVTKTKEIESDKKIITEYEIKPKKPKSEAKKAADRRYAQKVQREGRISLFETSLKTEELKEIEEIIKNAGLTKSDFLRKAATALKEKKF